MVYLLQRHFSKFDTTYSTESIFNNELIFNFRVQVTNYYFFTKVIDNTITKYQIII